MSGCILYWMWSIRMGLWSIYLNLWYTRSNKDIPKPFSWLIRDNTVAGSCSGSPTCIILSHPNLNGIKESTSKHCAALEILNYFFFNLKMIYFTSSIIITFINEFPLFFSGVKQSNRLLPEKFKVLIIISASLSTFSFAWASNFFLSTYDISFDLFLASWFSNFFIFILSSSSSFSASLSYKKIILFLQI